MKQTTNYDFMYPEPDDFGNGPLDLQLIAEQAEAQILSVQAGYALVNKKPTIVMQTTSTVTLNGNQGITPFTPPNVLSSAAVTYQYGFDAGIFNLATMPAGSYLFGASAQFLSSGALTANSYRQMSISAATPNGPQFNNYKLSTYTTAGADNSLSFGVCLSVVGTFDYVPAINPAVQQPNLWWGFQHNNANQVVMQIGAQFFCTKFSEIGA